MAAQATRQPQPKASATPRKNALPPPTGPILLRKGPVRKAIGPV
jgi:hypothetical protein